MVLLVLMLAFGLHARLSQYLPEAAHHPTPLALYDQDAQNSKNICASQSREIHSSVAFALFDVERMSQLLHRTIPARRDRQLGNSVRSALPYYPATLYFRPPPSLLS